MANKYDYLIVGAGIIGLTVARAINQKKMGSVCVLEKEQSLGCHASGRNSGVLHAGLYYPEGTLKAKVCVQGRRLLHEYALKNRIPVQTNGKVIVAHSQESSAQIDFLYKRGLANGVQLRMIDKEELRKVEPQASTFDNALHSPETAVIDSKAVLACLKEGLMEKGVQIKMNALYQKIDIEKKSITLQSGDRLSFKHLINAAGLFADKVAHDCGAGLRYAILPFKGSYRKLTEKASSRFLGSIYPVPDLKMPFLGVHLTKNINGDVWAGPTATPAWGRENYKAVEGLNFLETPQIAYRLAKMFLTNRQNFRNLVFSELRNFSAKKYLQELQMLAPNLKEDDLQQGVSKAGIRAQLFDCTKNEMVMDFIIEKGKRSTHILNAISPAFTASFAFADHVVENYLNGVES